MDYREAVIDCVEYLRDGYKREGIAIFNNIDSLRENLKAGYFSEQKEENSFEDHHSPAIIVDHIVSSVISEIFGDLYATGQYNLNVVDNALAQLRRRGVISH